MPDATPPRALRSALARVVRAGGIALSVLTLLGALTELWFDRETDITQWKQTASNISITLARHAEQTIRAADLVLQSIVDPLNAAGLDSTADLWRATDTPAMHEAIRNKVAGVPQVAVAGIIDERGEMLNFNHYYPPFAPNSPGQRLNLAHRDYYKVLMSGPFQGLYISAPV